MTRKTLLVGASAPAMLLMLSTAPAIAQQAAQADTAEIVVTGTRIVRDGFEAPTPVTVIGAQELLETADANITEYLNTLPAVNSSLTITGNQTSLGTRQLGLSSINLRNLGANRTLVLLDGVRIQPSHLLGFVDAGTIPQQLVQRVDVVTGGASAAYGSDAVAGVVNYILDKDFVGLKGQVDSGITAYGDNFTWNVQLTAGTTFAGGRGHFMISGEANREKSINGDARKWNFRTLGTIQNPKYKAGNGEPQYLILNDVVQTRTTRGGVITSGPLRGIAFGQGGSVYRLPIDPNRCDANVCAMPEWLPEKINYEFGNQIQPTQGRKNAFMRAEYDITDTTSVFAQIMWGQAVSGDRSQFNLLQKCCNISIDNAFLPEEVRSLMMDLGLTTFNMGSNIIDLPQLVQHAHRRSLSWTVGSNGVIDAFDTSWNWEAAVTQGKTFTQLDQPFAYEKSRFGWAYNAVRDPNTGLIVCSINADADPTNDQPDCQPLNIFGWDVATEPAKKYVGANPRPFYDETITETFATFSANGSPFEIWAGPVSLAFGASYRKDSVHSFANQDINALNGVPVNNQNSGNWLANGPGSYNVTEGYLETVVPLVVGAPMAESLELNGAVRFTSYSEAGFVTTWKVGVTYNPIDEIRFRFTQSRDIREPSLQDLFVNGAVTIGGTINRDVEGLGTINAIQNVTGNRSGLLRPEKADSTNIGAVISPSFAPGFTASVDYFRIKVKDAINSVGTQTVYDLCQSSGSEQFCSALHYVDVNGEPFLKVDRVPFNLSKRDVEGMDLEASYRMPADLIFDSWTGDIAIRALATHYMHDISETGIAGDEPVDSAGDDPRSWRWSASINWANETWNARVRANGLSSGTIDNTRIVCTSGCPVSTAIHRTYNSNYMPAGYWLDASFSYKFGIGNANTEWFFSVNNLLDAWPAEQPENPNCICSGDRSANGYDVKGRRFRTGLRFEL